MAKRPHLRLVEEFMEQPAPSRGGRKRSQRTSRQASRDARLEEGLHTRPVEVAKKINSIKAKTPAQQYAFDVMRASDLSFLVGAAGSGKTLMAVSEAVDALDAKRVNRIILTRPAVEAGEKLGFLPGDMSEKLDPFMRPLYDALLRKMTPQRMTALLNDRTIEITSIGFLRGRNLDESAIIVDEAQNATLAQLQMVTTRIGTGSFMVVTGDPTQSDLKFGESGLLPLLALVEGMDTKIGVARLSEIDVVRHPVVRTLIRLFG